MVLNLEYKFFQTRMITTPHISTTPITILEVPICMLV